MKYILNLKSKIMSYNIVKKESYIKYVIFCIIAIVYLILSGMYFDDRIYISMNTNIMVPIFAKTKYINTHGGFHGDGHTIGIVYLTRGQTNRLLKQISNNKYWKKAPTNEHLLTHIYDDMYDYDYSLNFCPELNDYYWYFYDRHSLATDIFDINATFNSKKRNSFNYTAAIFDKLKQRIIYYELDT